jgi:hypothetical protein
MTPHDHLWALAYLDGQRESISVADGQPQCSSVDALLGLVHLGARLRGLTRDAASPYELALRRLTFCTDNLLATILAPGDDDADAEIVRAWEQARGELESLR